MMLIPFELNLHEPPSGFDKKKLEILCEILQGCSGFWVSKVLVSSTSTLPKACICKADEINEDTSSYVKYPADGLEH